MNRTLFCLYLFLQSYMLAVLAWFQASPGYSQRSPLLVPSSTSSTTFPHGTVVRHHKQVEKDPSDRTTTVVSSHSSSRIISTDHDPQLLIETQSPRFHPIRVLGVCGSIGSGKSYACSLLVSHLNCTRHIDVDSLAHGVYAVGSHALEEIQQEFGSQVIHPEDGTVNRKALGQIVFGNATAMTRLERIVWPHVKTSLIHRLDEIQRNFTESSSNSSLMNRPPIVVVEAAVLLDANWDDDGIFDGVWVIEASTDTTTNRLVNKRGMMESDAKLRISAQKHRRGICNIQEDLKIGIITATIQNDRDDADQVAQRESILLNKLQKALTNPSCWKPGRFPM